MRLIGLDIEWNLLTHWGRATHICVGKLTIIGSDNGLSPGRRQAIIWTNAGILIIWPLGINFNEILIEIYTFLFKKIHLKVSSGKWRPSCLGLNVLSRYLGGIDEAYIEDELIKHMHATQKQVVQSEVIAQLLSSWIAYNSGVWVSESWEN